MSGLKGMTLLVAAGVVSLAVSAAAARSVVGNDRVQGVVALPAAAAENRVLMLVFDRTSVADADVKSAAIVLRDWTAGRTLPPDTAFGVATIGPSLRMEQDLTTDRGILGAALANLDGSASAGSAGSTGADSFRGLAVLCDALHNLPGRKGMVFVGRPPAQGGMLDIESERTAVNACTAANVSIYPYYVAR